MKTNTDKYEATHGKKPSGRATWWFEITASGRDGSFLTETFSGRGTVAEARKMAVRTLKDTTAGVEKVLEVVILP